MPKLTFSTDELPPGLPESALTAAWSEDFERKLGASGAEVRVSLERGPLARIDMVPLEQLAIFTLKGSFTRLTRYHSGIQADGSDALCLVLNRGPEPYRMSQSGREVFIEAGQTTLFSEGMIGHFEPNAAANTVTIRLPASTLTSAIRHPEDIIGQPLSSASEPLRMLDAYARTMMDVGGIDDPTTARSISSHLVDLVGLALAPNSEAAEAARRGGLRTSRVHALLGEIAANYQNPDFSIQQVAAKHRVTPRYLQDLLHETGISFSERVLELRLRYASELLARAHLTRRKISDIAYSSGFNDLSYFHRCFRRRFGMTPTAAQAVE